MNDLKGMGWNCRQNGVSLGGTNGWIKMWGSEDNREITAIGVRQLFAVIGKKLPE